MCERSSKLEITQSKVLHKIIEIEQIKSSDKKKPSKLHICNSGHIVEFMI